MEFGSGHLLHRLVLEFYASGNVILLDSASVILSILRPVTSENLDHQMVTYESYNTDFVRYHSPSSLDQLKEILASHSPENPPQSDILKKQLNFKLDYSAPLIEHCLLSAGLSLNRNFVKSPLSEDELISLQRWLAWADEFLDLSTKHGSKVRVLSSLSLTLCLTNLHAY